MHNQFKNKLLIENCFHVTFFAKFIQKNILIESNVEVTIGFIRDKSFDEEFFLVIESKEFNQNGMKDKRIIPVEDILEIEHTNNTRFLIHYMDSKISTSKSTINSQNNSSNAQKIAGAIGGFFKKIKSKNADDSEQI